MIDIPLKTRFGKLNSMLYRSVESAALLCKRKGHAQVGLGHWLLELTTTPELDFEVIMREFAVPVAAVGRELNTRVDALQRVAHPPGGIDPLIAVALDTAWLIATLRFGVSAIRSAHLLTALLSNGQLRAEVASLCPPLLAVNPDKLVEFFDTSEPRSGEDRLQANDGTTVGLANDPVRRQLFVSYRRSESEHVTGRLFDHLVNAFGATKVFKDVNSIAVGTPDFAVELRKELATARVVVVVIGPHWLTVRDESGRRRLDDADDFVLLEVTWALEHKVTIVPVLFDGARMPTAAELPAALKALSTCQAMRLSGDPDFLAGAQKLIAVCRQHVDA